MEEGWVLGIEAEERTDALIARCANLMRSREKAFLVKALKTTQDPELDPPAVGLKTLSFSINMVIKGLPAIKYFGLIKSGLFQIRG